MLFFCPFLDLTVSFHFYWMELMWIIMFYEFLDSHSDGTHSLQIIYWWVSNVMLNFSKSVPMKNKKKYIKSWMAWGWVHFQQFFIFGWTITLSCPCLLLYQYLLREPVRRSSRFCKWLDGSAHRHPNTCTKHMNVMVHVKLKARLALLILNQWFSRVSFIMNWNIF